MNSRSNDLVLTTDSLDAVSGGDDRYRDCFDSKYIRTHGYYWRYECLAAERGRFDYYDQLNRSSGYYGAFGQEPYEI